jgi:DNA polymerase-3 subunit epsilon
MKLLFFDLETTGFGCDKCAIVQIGAIAVELDSNNNLKPIDAINLKMRPRKGKWVDQRSFAFTGFTIDELTTWQDDKIAFEKFTKFLGKHVDKFNKVDKFTLVGYNSLHFDIDFLRQWFLDNNDKFFGSWFWTNSIDIISEASRYLIQYRPALHNFKLGNVAKAMGINVDETYLHDGLYDIKLTYKIFEKIIKSNSLIKEFDPTEASLMFENDMIEKSKEKIPEQKFTEEDAWIQI